MIPAKAHDRTYMTGPSRMATQVRSCPFCGLSTDVPHETQAGCIAALKAEVSRMRDLLDRLKPVAPPPAPPPGPEKHT